MKLKLCTALLTAATLFAPLSSVAEKAQDPAVANRSAAAAAAYGRLPLGFEPTESPARFLARSGSYAVLVGAGQSSVAVTDKKSGKHQTLRFAFDHANPAATLEAMEPQPGVTNYYLGRDQSKWRLGVKSYARLRSAGVYPGVDVVYYGDHRRLEFDFVVAPKADTGAIALSFSGMDKFYKEADGDLVAEVGGQPVRFVKPYAYQKIDGANRAVDADYELTADGKVHLRMGDYDRNRELIVDPVVSYISYLGGTSTDVGNGIAVDSTGAFVTGQTCSSDFDPPPGRATYNNGTFTTSCDAYVTKFSLDGSTFVFTTILGGATPFDATAVGNGIALDSSNAANLATQVYIIGTTNFTDLPFVPSGYTNNLNSWQGGDSDAFIAILNSTTGEFVRTSYLGGTSADSGYGIAVDANQNVIAVGQTCSDDFPAYSAFETKVEPCVAFITKLDNGLHIATPTPGKYRQIAMAATPTPNPPGGTYYFSEFFGGQPVAPAHTNDWTPSTYFFPGSIIQDSNIPVPNIEITFAGGISGVFQPAWQTTALTSTVDNGITWVNLGPVALVPTHFTEAYGVALDPLGDVFVAGGTTTPNIASSVWPFERVSYAGTGAWVIKVNGQSAGYPGAWVYGLPLEGTPTDTSATIDTSRAIAVDNSGRAYITGTATGTLLGTSHSSYKSTVTGGEDAFLVRMNTAGSAIEYATYLGGSGNDQGLGVAVDGSGAAYVTGSTQSPDFPTINPLTFPDGTPLQTVSGGQDAFLTKFTTDGSALIFSAYLGGSDLDLSNSIAVATDPTNTNSINMFVAGNTYSTDLNELNPAAYTAPQPQYGTNGTNGNGDAFMAMVAGSSLATSTVTPGTLNFAAQDVNTSSIPPTNTNCLTPGSGCIQYTNTNGTSTITISSIIFSNGEFAQFPMSGSNPANCSTGVIPPNTACDLWVVFTPAGQGNRSGTVSITDDASSKPHVVDLSGQGTVPQDALTASSLDFPSQGVNTTSPLPLSVGLQNTGNGTLYISGGISISGTNAGDFNIVTDTCGPQLLAGASCSISVSFTPGGAGKRTASLVISDNASPYTHSVGLSGVGVLVASTVAPTSLVYPQQGLNVASVPQTACLPGGIAGDCYVTVTNTDPAQTLVVGTPVTTGDFQVSNNGCTQPVPPVAGAVISSCTIQVAFYPTVPGTRVGTLLVSSNGTTTPVSIALSGTAGATATLCAGPCTTPPSAATFTGTNVGATSAAQVVTLSNLSPFAFNVQSVVISGPAAGDFSQTSNCGTSVQKSPATCSINLSFKPTATGNRDATVTVTSDAAASPQSVSILGVGTAPLVTLAPPTNLIFPSQPLNSPSGPSFITLTNTGTGPLNIPAGGITITGTAAGDFSQTNNCGTQVAANGGFCTINVVFTPTAPYSRSASLNIADDAIPNPQIISLLGIGAQAPIVGVSTASLTFPNQALGVPSASQPVTLTNTGIGALNFTSIGIAGTNQADFSQTNTCGPQVLPNASCVINVTFTPSALNSRVASLVFTDDAASSPQSVALSGTGINPSGSIQLSATTVNFGAPQLNIPSTPQTITLTNSAASVLTISNIQVGGNGDFAISSSSTCSSAFPFNLNSGASCNIVLIFTPSVYGTENASMTVSGSAANSPQSVTLTGTGSTPPDFNVIPTSSSATGQSVTQGDTATYTLSVAPMNGYTGTVTFTCSGLPAGSCSISPSQVAMDGVTVPTVKVYVNTAGSSAKMARPQLVPRSVFLALLPFSMMGMLLINKRRGIWLALGLVVLCLLLGMVGCGSNSSSSSNALTPGTTYQFTLTGTASGGVPETQVIPLTLVVNKQ
jgi:hypothetical protein